MLTQSRGVSNKKAPKVINKKSLANLLFLRGGVLGYFGGNRRGAYSVLYVYSSNSKKLEKYYHRCKKLSLFSACCM